MRQKQLPKIIGERDIVLDIGTTIHEDKIVRIGKALSSPVRIRMMHMLRSTPMSVQEIAQAMELPISSTAMHILAMEVAGLVVTESQPGVRGSMRVCLCTIQSIHLDFLEPDFNLEERTITLEMPIGAYFDWDVEPTCGLADENGLMENCDNPKVFYSTRRQQAQLMWFQQGYVEYRFPNCCEGRPQPKEISFSMELCSEAPGYMENWPSDITVSVNGQEVGTFRSPGDFGARRGILTPTAWGYGRTQYGLLKTFAVRHGGGYIDGELSISGLAVPDLDLQQKPYISLRIEIKKTAQYIGGINLFGDRYGDYSQGIVMRVQY